MIPGGDAGLGTCASAGAPELSPPCRTACPLDKDVPGFLRAIAHGDSERAWQIALRDNLFPGVLGWICPRPCETVCRRARLTGPVPICRLKRWVGGREGNGKHRAPRLEPTGPSVAVVGAGPAGLAAAHDLAVLGARVSLFDARSEPGGLLNACIPGFRLPEDVVRDDIERILSLGIEFHPGARFSGLEEAATALSPEHAAVVLALGGGSDRTPEVPGWTPSRSVWTAIDFLAAYRAGRMTEPVGRTVVIGGGNAALDVARTARRLGGTEVLVVYRRGEREMRVLPGEIEEARNEGVRFRLECLVREVVWEGDRLIGILLGPSDSVPGAPPAAPDRSDRAEAGGRGTSGATFLPVDTLVSAIGQVQPFRAPGIEVGEGATSLPGFFACGDYATGPTTVAEAIASGRRVAARVRAALARGGAWPLPERALSRLQHGYLPQAANRPSLVPSPADPSWQEARSDAGACLGCDQVLRLHADRCVLCGECSTRCPEDSLRWNPNPNTGGYVLSVDDATCTRCGDCVRGCPVGAIHWSLWTRPNRNIEALTA